MLRSFLKKNQTLSKTTRFISKNKPLFDNKQKNQNNKKGLDFWFGEGEDNAHPNTKHYNLPEEQFGKYWHAVPSVYEQSVGLERAEIMDPFYFDELLVSCVGRITLFLILFFFFFLSQLLLMLKKVLDLQENIQLLYQLWVIKKELSLVMETVEVCFYFSTF